MKDNRVSPISIREIGRKCRAAHKAEFEGASWLKRMSFCAADILREIKAGFNAQVDYPLGKLWDR